MLHDRDDITLVFAHIVGGLLHRLFETRYEEEQERRHPHGHERKVKVEIKHQDKHPDDVQRIDEHVQQR